MYKDVDFSEPDESQSPTADDLYRLARIEPTGTTQWGEHVPCKGPGVYIISIEEQIVYIGKIETAR
jgi:hypothetical protein